VELRLHEGFEVTLRKPEANVVSVPQAVAAPVAMVPTPAPAPVEAIPTEAATTGDEGFMPVKSPLVGTFYRSSAPDMPPFVTEGAMVTKDSVICVIEAMKTVNEIRAEASGTVARVAVENGEPVEYGQTLFLIRPCPGVLPVQSQADAKAGRAGRKALRFVA